MRTSYQFLYTRSFLLLFLILGISVFSLGIGTIAPVHAQEAATATPVSEIVSSPTPDAETDIDAIRQAALLQIEQHPELVFPSFQPYQVEDVNLDGEWAVLNMASYPSDPSPDIELLVPNVILGIAHKNELGVWDLYLEFTEDFQLWLPNVAEAVLPAESKEILLLSVMPNDVSSNATYQIPGLPWAVNTSWRYNQGPHGGTQDALDFGVPSVGVSASVKAADAGTVVYRTETCIAIKRSDNLRLWYQHIRPSDISRFSVGAAVAKGQDIGMTTTESGCSGSSSGHHLHFYWDISSTQPVAAEGTSLNGWVVVGDQLKKNGVVVNPNMIDTILHSNTNTPGAPTGVSATDGTYTGYTHVSWSTVSGATSYDVWRNTANTTTGATKIGAVSTTSYNDTTATPLLPYFYWVKACNSNGCSGFSSANAGYRGQEGVVIVSAPTLTPAYSGDMCGSSWHQISGFGEAKAFLTMNTNQAAQSTNSGVWQNVLPITGIYKVEVFIPDHGVTSWQCPTMTISYDTGDAKYTIYHANGTTTVSKNQSPLSNAWLSLGNYSFNAGSTGKVKLVDLNGETNLSRTVSFSALRFSLVEAALPGAFTKLGPSSGATNQPTTATLSWGASSGSTSYEYCFDTSNDDVCSNWISNGLSTNVVLSSLASSTTYYWNVRATNAGGTTFANGDAAAFWSFTTMSVLPGSFNKSGPANGVVDQPLSLTLSWNASNGATSYEYCYDAINDNICSNWINNGTSTNVAVDTLLPATTYYWHVRAINSDGTVDSDGGSGAFWSFTTLSNLPGEFDKSAPLLGATNQPANVMVTWNASVGAAYYEYCYDTTGDSICSEWMVSSDPTGAVLTDLAPGTIYYWQVRAGNDSGLTYANGHEANDWSFTTGVLPESFGKLTPINGATGRPTTQTIYWGVSNGATSYEYCYDTTNDGICADWIDTGPSRQVTLSELNTNTTYYWNVRAINSIGVTYASDDDWSFTTVTPPGAFNKSGPANAATGKPVTQSLYWSASSAATSYEYCYDIINDGECGTWVSTGLARNVTLSGLSEGTTYYWQVRARNADGTTYANGSSTSYWSFSTVALPGSFNKTTPVSGATGRPTTQALYWSASSGATSYEYCYDTSNDGACAVWINTTARSVTLSGLAEGTTYYWQVRAKNTGGTTYANGSSTSYWYFSTLINPPAAFNKSAPANGATGKPTTQTLYWSASTGATSYEYCYDTTNDGACSTWISTTARNATLSGLVQATTYYWQVRAKNAAGKVYADAGSGAYWSFTTAGLPGAFNKTAPADGATGKPTTQSLYWSASSGAVNYEYCISTVRDQCSTWVSTGAARNVLISGLAPTTTYYWQVRAINPTGTVYANGAESTIWSFTTAP